MNDDVKYSNDIGKIKSDLSDKICRLNPTPKGAGQLRNTIEQIFDNGVMDKGDFKLISLGIAMKLPKGYEAHIVPRSSTFKNFGIIQTNHQAVIDESYCGDEDVWRYPALAMRHTVIHKGDRICQFRIMQKMPPVRFEEVDKLENPSRGGIGSTGVN